MRLTSKLTERRKLVITERLRRLSVWGHPALRVGFRLQGTAGYIYGCRAGPSIDFKHLAHELAHAVQFGADAFPTRMLGSGTFRFKCRQVYFNGQAYDEPMKNQCTRREVETFAIQLHLMELAGCKVSKEAFRAEVPSTCEWLPDWWCFPKKTRNATIEKMFDKYYAKWTPEKVMSGLTAWLDRQQARLSRGRNREHLGTADLSFAAPVRRKAPTPPLELLAA